MTTTRRLPRRDPYQLFKIHTDFAAGLDAQSIAQKHGLPVPAVLQIVRDRRGETGLVNPFQLAQDSARGGSANQLYWLGYIAACGRLFPQGPAPTLVLDLDTRDVDHIKVLVEDMCAGRPSVELCKSSQNGLQAYVRDRELGQLLSQWGVPGDDPTEGSVPISLIPGSLLPHFLRGYLEGSRQTPPFGGQSTPASLPAVRTVVIVGPEEFVSPLGSALRRHLGLAVPATTGRRDRQRVLTYRGRAARQIVQYAYHNPTRSLPRLDRMIQSLRPRTHGRSLRARKRARA